MQVQQIPDLDPAEIDRARLPLTQAFTLPPAAYTSAAVYELEAETIFKKSWIPLVRLDQIPEPGDFMSFDILGQPIMAVHGQDGEYRVMSRVCLHRAAPVAEGAGRAKSFMCPYHAWVYDTAGRLVRAPLMDGSEGFTEGGCALPQLRTEIWEGFLLANLDPQAEPFAPQAEGFRKYFENFRLKDMVVVRTLDFPSGWNWKVLVENFMEAYHHIAAHAHTLEPAFHAKDSKVPDNDGPWSILHMPAAPENAHEPDEGGLPAIEGLEEWQAHDLFASVLFPHFMLALSGTGLFWYQVFPDGPDRLDLRIHVCVPKSSTERDGFDELASVTAELVGAVHQEDIVANDLVWAGLNAPMTEQGRLSPLEKSIWQLNQWWLDRMLSRTP